MDREKEFITIIENNKALIYKVAGFYTNQPQDREDLIQEIIYQLWKSVNSFRQQSSVSTWIYRVAMNTAIHFLRKQKRWVTKSIPEDRPDQPESDSQELEDLKADWAKVSDQLDRQLHVNTKLIHKMTQQQYRSQFNRIAYPEVLGSLVLLFIAGWLFWNFDRLDTMVLRICGGISALLLIALPLVSLESLKGLGRIEIGATSYAETVRAWAVRKRRFIRLQRFNKVLTTPFVVVITPTMVRLLADKDITRRTSFWLFVIPVCLVIQILFARCAFRHYDRSMNQAEALLEDLS